jgi:hypothetical protein
MLSHPTEPVFPQIARKEVPISGGPDETIPDVRRGHLRRCGRPSFARRTGRGIPGGVAFNSVRVGVGSTDNTIHHNRVAENGTASSPITRNGAGILLNGPSNNNQIL